MIERIKELHSKLVDRQTTATRQLDLSFEDAIPSRSIWTVGLLVQQVREMIEEKFLNVWVEGEISNFRAAPSGHFYFTLKDDDAQLPIVIFRRQAIMLRFRPEDGLHIVARGKVSVFEQRGQLQLVAETLEPVGTGSLQLAYERLKESLKAEGLFNLDRKRVLPLFPRTVGIITSPTGSVIRDFLNIVGRRHSALNVLVFPVSVQGDSSETEIEAAIADLNSTDLVDVIVLARGGGSLEDLAAFNSERVARAIAASRHPVVSAVGHETDFTIADFVADLRAPTPSAAAELITEAQHGVALRVMDLTKRLERAIRFQLLQMYKQFEGLHVERLEFRTNALLLRLDQRRDDAVYLMETALSIRLRKKYNSVDALSATVFRHDPRQKLAMARGRLESNSSRLDRSIEKIVHGSDSRLHEARASLHALSPLAVLNRGYSLVQDEDGILIRSITNFAKGDVLTTRMSDGSFTSRVETTSVVASKNMVQSRKRRKHE